MNIQPFASLSAVLRLHLLERPGAVFMLAPETGQTLTFAQLALAARRTAAMLHVLGHRPGDKIALLLPGGVHGATFTLALMMAGYIAVPLSLLAGEETLGWIIAHSRCRVVVTCGEHVARLRAALAALPADRRPGIALHEPDEPPLAPASAPPRPPELTRKTPALLIYTSGTTGKPKGVLLTQGNLLTAAGKIARWHQLTPLDRLLCAMPLYHINGLVIGTLVPFITGGSVVAPRRFSVSAWWEMVGTYRCSWLNLVPTMIAFLLDAAGPGPRRFPWVKFARSASAPLSPSQHRRFVSRFGIPVIEGMGMTESASLAFCNPHGGAVCGSVGLPCGITAAVCDRQGAHLADNRAGEIILRGANVMDGYYRDAAGSGAVIDARGWLHTGDLGHRDSRGFYFITGRLKEIIIKGGENIAPQEIDEALNDFPAIREAAAFAIPDAAYGQNIAAALVVDAGAVLDETALRDWCRDKLGAYKVPARFYVIEALPRGGSGKIQRLALCARLVTSLPKK